MIEHANEITKQIESLMEQKGLKGACHFELREDNFWVGFTFDACGKMSPINVGCRNNLDRSPEYFTRVAASRFSSVHKTHPACP